MKMATKALTSSYGKHNDGFLSLTLSEFLWLTCLTLLIFSNAIETATGFSYTDEIATVLLVVAAGAKRAGLPRSRLERIALRLLGFVAAIGLLGNVIYKVQDNVLPVFIDLFTCCKFPLALLASISLFHDSHKLASYAELEAKLLVYITFIFGLANLFVPFGMESAGRFGIARSFKFCFYHPTYLVFYLVGLLALLLRHPQKNRAAIIIALITMCMSLRVKAFAYAVVALFLAFTMGRRQKLTAFHVLLAVGIALLIGWDNYTTYYQTNGYARTELVRVSIVLANNFFPIGSGFGTYGSAVSGSEQWYSPLYYQYGLSTVYGLAPGHADFLSDTFWPTVIGQFGCTGLLGYVACIIVLIRRCYLHNEQRRLAVISCFAYLLISSTSESAFFNPSAVVLAMCLGVAIARPEKRY